MASELAVTNRKMGSHGHYRREIGQFTDDTTTGNYHIKTKVGRLVWFRVQCATAADNTLLYTLNLDSTPVTVSGAVYFASGVSSGGTYTYEAIGMG